MGHRRSEKGVDPMPPLADVAAEVPERAERSHQSQAELVVAVLGGPIQSREKVASVMFESLQPEPLLGRSDQVCACRFCQLQEVAGVAFTRLVLRRAVCESFETVFAD